MNKVGATRLRSQYSRKTLLSQIGWAGLFLAPNFILVMLFTLIPAVGGLALSTVELTGWWMLAVLVTFAPIYGGSFQYLLNVAQHIGLTDQVNGYRIDTRTIALNPILAFL